jgi:hypothetical protein
MSRSRLPRPLLAFAIAVAATGLLAPAAAASDSTDTAGARSHAIDMRVRVDGFAVWRGRTVAKGVVTARTDGPGTTRTSRRPVTLEVKATRYCRVLNLYLKTANVFLLGLHVDVSTITLRITGDSNGGALGRLFCQLSRGIRLSSASAQRAIARTLDRRVEARPLQVVGAHMKAIPVTAGGTATRCEVLNVVIGPLNLNLLGLIVDLYGQTRRDPVRIRVSADPNGGIVGDLFCDLANSGANVQLPPVVQTP